MKLKSQLAFTFLITALVFMIACNDEAKTSETSEDKTKTTQEAQTDQSEVHGTMLTADDVVVSTPLNDKWVTNGKAIYDLKCQSCHKLNEERVVGPGWKGVTQRREPHWIMNMITNVDMMLEKDPEAQKLLEQCLVRMPNQNIDKDQARHILEFMRSNDGVK